MHAPWQRAAVPPDPAATAPNILLMPSLMPPVRCTRSLNLAAAFNHTGVSSVAMQLRQSPKALARNRLGQQLLLAALPIIPEIVATAVHTDTTALKWLYMLRLLRLARVFRLLKVRGQRNGVPVHGV